MNGEQWYLKVYFYKDDSILIEFSNSLTWNLGRSVILIDVCNHDDVYAHLYILFINHSWVTTNDAKLLLEEEGLGQTKMLAYREAIINLCAANNIPLWGEAPIYAVDLLALIPGF